MDNGQSMGGKFPVPLKSSLYNDITHLVYGFMGFNDKGLLGSWDGWADFGNFNTTGKNEPYGPQFINAFWGIGSKGPTGKEFGGIDAQLGISTYLSSMIPSGGPLLPIPQNALINCGP